MEGPSLSAEGKLVMPEVRSRNGENSRAVGLAWKALSKEEKQRWEAESQKDLKRYQAECAQAGVEPKLYSHVAGQLRNARRAVRPVDNVGGAGLVDPKAAIYEAFDANQLKKKCASGDYELLMVKNDMAAPTR